jgi:hypothetical protein
VENTVVKKVKFLFIPITIVALLGAVFLFYFVSDFDSDSEGNIPTYYAHGGYAIDINDTRAVVGDADYLFVGKVDAEIETVYEDDIVTEDKVYAGTAHTIYEVSVIDNIKNNLIVDTPIIIAKLGGIRQDHSAYDLPEGDFLLDEGEFYIFAAYTQDDGTLMVGGANSTISFKEESEQMILNGELSITKEYNEYLDAYQNQTMQWKETDNTECMYDAEELY